MARKRSRRWGVGVGRSSWRWSPAARASVPASAQVLEVKVPTVEGPIPTTAPDAGGDRLAAYGRGHVSVVLDVDRSGAKHGTSRRSSTCPGWPTAGSTTGAPVGDRRPVRDPHGRAAAGKRPLRFNGTALVEWQNVTAGYDLDALWNGEAIMRAGYAWVGVSAQRVGVNQLRGWSPTRYGALDVTGGGRVRGRRAVLRHLRPGGQGAASAGPASTDGRAARSTRCWPSARRSRPAG